MKSNWGVVVLICAAPLPAWSAVDLNGLDEAQEANVRAHLALQDLGCDAPLWLVRRQFRRAEAEVRGALEALGFYGVRTEAELEFPEEACWLAVLTIDPGTPVSIAEVKVLIEEPLGSEPEMKKFLRLGQDLVDEVLDHGRYETYKRALVSTAQALGYFDARFSEHRVVVDAKQHRAEIQLRLDGGTRYRFGPIDVRSRALTPELVRAFVPFTEGDPYDAAQVSKLRRDLNDSGYFGEVRVIAEPSTSGEPEVPVVLETEAPEPRRVYTVGVGYATDTGLRLRGDFTDRLVNRRGHRAHVGLLLSPVRSTLDASYRLPHTNPVDDWFSFDAGITQEDTDTSETDAKRIGVRHIHERGAWAETNYVEASWDDFEIAGERSTSQLLMFGTSWTRTESDSSSRPTRGYRLGGDLRGATRTLLSDNDFVQVRVNGKYLRSISESVRVLVRAEGGWTAKDEFSELPPSVRFFAGGDNSIRGYGYQELGPESEGEVVGGSRLLTGSLELDWEFRGKWALAVFGDAGSAFNSTPEFSTGVGIGVRWYSPLGPVRFDLAHPLDGDDAVRVHITVGPDL